MKHVHDWRFALTVFSLCIFWYASSSAGSILNKLILQQFPYPLTVSMSSLLGTSLYSIPWMSRTKVPRINLPTGYLLKFVVPLALGKVIAVCLSYFSLWKVPVSYAHTVKATMPFFAVICARFILHEHQSLTICLSLVPIIIGVIITSATELSFSASGMLSALCSTFTYALLNTVVKKVLQETGLHHIKLLSVITQIACAVLFPFWLVIDVPNLWHDSVNEDGKGSMTAVILGMLFASGIIHFLQNLCSFTLIHKLTALSYAVASATKRITVITVSLLTLKNPVTSVNVFGMFMAVLGVLAYNRAKQMQKAAPLSPGPTTPESAAMLLPMSMSDPNISEANLMLRFTNEPVLPTTVHKAGNGGQYANNSSTTAWRRSPPNGHSTSGANGNGPSGARFYINGQFEDV